jgi:GT2 family glycosyltransferase
MGFPLVSVIILNYKRRDALKLALDSVLRQEYPNREIIVVDNHSEDDTAAVVRAAGSNVVFIELPTNVGASGGRNAGIRAARGDIVVTLDNDVVLLSPFELGKAVKAFEDRPKIHVIAFQVCDHQTGELRLREWCHPRSWKDFAQSEFETHFFVEGACAYRREVFDVAGFYYEPLFIYTEGYDLALRILDRGLKILYCPGIRVGHLMSPETRTRERPFYLFTRNYIWIAYKDYRLLDGLRFLAPKLAMMLYFTLRSGCYRAFLRGLWDGIRRLPVIRRDRTPIGKATVRYLDELERWRPGLLFRLARHRSQPQL